MRDANSTEPRYPQEGLDNLRSAQKEIIKILQDNPQISHVKVFEETYSICSWAHRPQDCPLLLGCASSSCRRMIIKSDGN